MYLAQVDSPMRYDKGLDAIRIVLLLFSFFTCALMHVLYIHA